MSADDIEKQPLLAPQQSPIQIRPASLADAGLLASIVLQSFRNAPFYDWVSCKSR